ncbi:MAG: efflux RND transporter permease subunit [Candidatus Dadabacteria bacterium]|nr:MAG: efflux RND transporter permease subunit [Candidatus Dadabacteria bacterium]
MIARVINFSLDNKFLVLLMALFIGAGGYYAVSRTPLDAIPDLSDVQVIIFTEYPGQAPQIVEDQVTYPLTTKMLSVPYAKVVRGYSFFNYSFVYVIFEDGTDMYWARSRVLEYLSQLQGQLPEGVTPTLGPDATGVGWAFMYVLTSPKRDLQQLRSIQDWYLKYELTSVEGVSEVASVGGYVKQYQVTVDPEKLRAYDIPLSKVVRAVRRSNNEVGGRVLEMSETEYILRVKGYIHSPRELEQTAVGSRPDGTPILLSDIATVAVGPDMRRGIAEWNGQGEAVGGIVVVRYGANALDVIRRVKKKLAELKKGLPDDVEIHVAYDRSALIERSIDTLREKLIEESIAVSAVCVAFLFHFRSALVAILTLPMAVLAAFIIMYVQGIGANIMSLGGIAIAIGAMIDAVIVMIENAHQHIERDKGQTPRWELVRSASIEVGPALFFSLLVITVSFMPVFTLEAQEGRLFKPLAFTKTYSMATAAFLSITLAPVLMGYFIRGRIVPEEKNPLNRWLIAAYHPVINWLLRHKRTCWGVILAGVIAVVATWWPYSRLGSEFMPPLYEGDLLYMPTTLPGISITKARELLQQTDRIIKQFPEVHHVFGKIGRAETATDPAPLSMIETTIMLKPEEEWPEVDITDMEGHVIAHRRRTPEELVDALNAAIPYPGVTNAWTMPIKTRIDMLSTGIKTPVGIKISGPDIPTLQRIGEQVEAVVRQVPGTLSVYAERVAGGNYINFTIDRDEIARYGLTVGDVQDVIASAIGGMNVSTTVEGLERYPINIRYPRELRDNLDALKSILVPTPLGQHIPLAQLAHLEIVKGPPSIKSENSRPNTWIYVDLRNIDVGTYVKRAQKAVEEAIADGRIELPPGYNIFWSGQYEYMVRAQKRLLVVVPLTLLIIVVIIYLSTQSMFETMIVMLAVPFSLVGAVWLIWLLGYNMSIAVWVGIIALAGLDAETGVVMLLYLNVAYQEWVAKGAMRTLGDLREAIYHGAVRRLRPKAMTVAVILAGLLPIMWSHGTGADVMKRIAVPMVGGVVTSFLTILVVYPAIYFLWKSRGLEPGEPTLSEGAGKTG